MSVKEGEFLPWKHLYACHQHITNTNITTKGGVPGPRVRRAGSALLGLPCKVGATGIAAYWVWVSFSQQSLIILKIKQPGAHGGLSQLNVHLRLRS